MIFSEALIPGVLLRRYKRFLADVRLESGKTVVAHCANTGSMLGVSLPGSRVWLSRSDNPKRKLAWTSGGTGGCGGPGHPGRRGVLRAVEDVERVRPADHIDPVFGRALRDGAKAGVELYALGARLTPESITLERCLPVLL